MGLKMKSLKTGENKNCRVVKTATKLPAPAICVLSAIMAILMVLPLLFSCAPAGQGKSFLINDSGKSVALSPGDVFKVTLESNQTTGYSWKLSENMDQDIVLMTSSVYEVPKSSKDMVGAGGTETFSFKAQAQGKTSILLEYVRPWEEGVAPELTFTLNIEVK